MTWILRTLLVLLLSIPLLAGRAERYALILSDPPLAAESAGKTRAALAEREASIQKAQSSLVSALKDRNVQVVGASRTLVNAIYVQASPEQAAELRSLPGVARVQRLQVYRRVMTRAVDLVNARPAWTLLGGAQNSGAGVKIAIIDSGIDHTHPAFRDPSLAMPPGYPNCLRDRGDCDFTNNKIIAARSYVNLVADWDGKPENTRPDDLSPRDRVGHGTAAASVAAGVQHATPLGTFSGVAPKAWLGNYKVFGSPGVNDFTIEDAVVQALEDAYSDGMDVASVSLGAPAEWGPNDEGADCGKPAGVPCGLFAMAVNSASTRMTVVVAAGNDGDSSLQFPALNSINTPGSAPNAITVGASTNSHVLYSSLKAPAGPPNLQRVDAVFGSGPLPEAPVQAPLRDISSAGFDGKACSPLSGLNLAGAIALIQRGDCEFSVKVNHAQSAGAVAVVIYQREGVNSIFKAPGLQTTAIPMVMIGYDAGMALKNQLASTPGLQVILDPTLVEKNAEFDTVADFSSQGPSIGEDAIKPEVVAVGTDLYMATQSFDPNGDMYDPSRYTAAAGTSFSAPMVAGAVALVKQRQPTLTPAQLKSAVVNTASNTVDEFDSAGRRVRASVAAVGAGKLNVENAVRTNVTVTPSTLSFGALSASRALPQITLTVSNTGTASAALTFTVSRRTSDPATDIQVSPSSVNLGAGQQANVTVRLTGRVPSPGFYEGALVIQGGAVPLRVPYLYLVTDGRPFDIVPLKNYDYVGVVNSKLPGGFLFKVTDRYGLAVPDVPVRFRPGLGQELDANAPCPPQQGVYRAARATDSLGIAYAYACLGPSLGSQSFTAEAGVQNPLTITFLGRTILQPTIRSNGVVNAASGQVGRGLAPGSYISIFGSGLAEGSRVAFTPSLPLSLANVSVSFDTDSPRLSLPGRLHFVSPGQVNVQVPWELEGFNRVWIKVSMGWDFSTALYQAPLNAYSPAAFEYQEPGSGRMLAIALDSANRLIGTSNPAARNGIIQVYANGLGPVDVPQRTGEPAPADRLSRTRVQPVVTVGGRQATVEFSGLAPGYVGLYQLNVRVPADAPVGLQPLVISMGGVESKAATLPIQ